MIGTKTALIALILLMSLQAAGVTARAETGDRAAIETALKRYQAALNASDADQVLPLYDEDGVFMQPYTPSVIGKAAIRKTYEADFEAFTLAVTFHPIEVVIMASDWAFARTSSVGTQTIHATGAKDAEANQELFIFHKRSGVWLIACYAFSTIDPPVAR